METFYSLVKAVQENNRINGGQWKDWEDADHIQEVYGKLESLGYYHISRIFLNSLIENNGEGLETYLDCLDFISKGQVFARA